MSTGTRARSILPDQAPYPSRRSLVVSVWPMFVVLLVASQLALGWHTPLWLVHRHRVPYEIIRDDLRNLDLAIGAVSRYVRRNDIDDYLVILGDSVGYSGPGGPEQAVSRYLADLSRPEGGPVVFNFSIPGAQIGDIYVLLLKLHEHGLRPAHLVINTLYSGFMPRTPDPPPVFWLRDELTRLDPDASAVTPPASPPEQKDGTAADRLEERLVAAARRWLPVLAYRDFIREAALDAAGIAESEGRAPEAWYEKPWLDHYLRQPQYQRVYDLRPVVLDQSNPNVYFLERIVAAKAPHTQLLFFATPTNQSLLADIQADHRMAANRGRIDGYMRDLASGDPRVDYVDWTTAVPDDLFVDHLHLLPDGYRLLAELIWQRLAKAGTGACTEVAEQREVGY